MTSRRGALRLGGGAALALAGAGVWRAADRGLILAGSRDGLAAWRDWNEDRYSGPLALVSAGVLAASPLNSQPWRFAVGRLGVDIFDAPERTLGAIDPYGRERLAGLGAAIQNMALASTAIGRSALVRLLPDGPNPGHVARIELGPENGGVAPGALVAAIGRRHTDRSGWTGGPVPAAAVAAMAAASRSPDARVLLFAADSAPGRRFAALTADAGAAITEDPALVAARHAWWRPGRSEEAAHRDGLSIDTAGYGAVQRTLAAMLPAPGATALARDWLAHLRGTVLPSASLFGLVLVRDPDDRRAALLAGMAWQRLHLIAAARGLAAQPLSQIVQAIDRERQLARAPRFANAALALHGDADWQPAMGFRIGLASGPAPSSVRRPVSQVIGGPARLDYEIERARAETQAQDRALPGHNQ